MNKVIINGRTYRCNFYGISSANNMHIVIEGLTIVDAAMLFSNPANLGKIMFVLNEKGETDDYTGYVHLTNLSPEGNGVRVTLRQM